MAPALPEVAPLTFLAVERQEVIAASIHEYDHTGACTLSRAATSTDRLREPDHGVIMTWWNLR
jgi:hypothetical protein